MTSSVPSATAPDSAAADSPSWTYPTRSCRICWEEVYPTVAMYPPGIPMQFQTPVVEYKNDDEYGRLIRPCMCKGSSRYIHELCLLRSRTENDRLNSMWVCHECTHKFNFQKLKIQKYLSSKAAAALLTVLFMIYLMFVLGFIADPIINIYMDPYESLMGYESVWDELEVRSAKESQLSAWSQHFAKGFISIGLVGFLKTLLLNPLQWLNLRWGSGLSSRTATTGRDRAVNISWIALVIGICSAFVFFYKWTQAIMQRMLVRLGNNIVDTRLPGDDDDLKPPSGWKHAPSPTVATDSSADTEATAEPSKVAQESSAATEDPSPMDDSPAATAKQTVLSEVSANEPTQASTSGDVSSATMSGSWVSVDSADPTVDDEQDVLSSVRRQGWSFSNI